MLKFKQEDKSGEKQDWSGYDIVTRESLGEGKDRHPRLLIVEAASDAETNAKK